MKILSAQFVKSAYERLHWPGNDLPEIAFLGRSNVGKSSLINSLLGRKGIARTSNTPGRTQSINFFRVNETMYFADLPGYGYAKVSKTMREQWGKMAEQYLNQRENLALCIQLVDSRHEPTKLDRQLHEWLQASQRPSIIVATKTDKLSSNQLRKSIVAIEKDLSDRPVLIYSAVTGKGRDQLWQLINSAIVDFRK